MGFIGTLQSLILGDPAPYYIRQKNIGTFLESLGITLDAHLEDLAQGLRLSQPLRCDSSALPSLSLDRGIAIPPTAPVAAVRELLARWWPLHKRRGSHQGELRHVQPYFLPSDFLPVAYVVHQVQNFTTWHKLSSDGVSSSSIEDNNFNFDDNGRTSAKPIAAPWAALANVIEGAQVTNDGQRLYQCITPGTTASSGGPTGTSANITDGSAHWRYAVPWSRWWAIIETPATSLQSGLTYYDDGSLYDGGQVYDGITPPGAGADLVNMLLGWKAAHSACWGVALSTQIINPSAVPTQDAAGWWNLPGAGEWGRRIDPATHKATRPPYLTWLLDRSQY